MYDPNKIGVDQVLINQYNIMPYVVVLTVVLVVTIIFMLIIRKNKMELNIKRKGIKSSIDNILAMRKRDNYILRVNTTLNKITSVIENSVLRLNKNNKEYVEYNLRRAGIKVPGGHRYLSAEEFNALTKVVLMLLLVMSLVIGITVSIIAGVFIAIISIIVISSFPMMFIRQTVRSNDEEIRYYFIDLYLMMHYVLMSRGSTPLERVLRSYSKMTQSKAMMEFVDNCVRYIDIYGEYGALSYITKDYREIAEVNKLMRLIKQFHDGGNIEQDLLGFRDELVKAKKYEIEAKMQKLVQTAKVSFAFLMVILVQAILSAWSTYLTDIKSGLDIFVK